MTRERLKDLIVQNSLLKDKTNKDSILFKSRKEVEINGNGTSGYVIKQGSNKNKVLKHIKLEPRNI